MKAKMMKNRLLISILILQTFVFISVTDGRVTRILSAEKRSDFIQRMEAVLSYQDETLRDNFPYVLNPFYFEQPLVLKLRVPGGVSDGDVLEAAAAMMAPEVSGAFVRGSKRSLLMKSGDLVKEGDQITRTLPQLGEIEATVLVSRIYRDGFSLVLNQSSIDVKLSDYQ